MLMAWETLFGICSGYISPYSFRSLTPSIVHSCEMLGGEVFLICFAQVSVSEASLRSAPK